MNPRSAFLFAVAVASGLSLPMSAAPASKSPLGSTVFEWKNLPVKITPKGERRDVANQPTPTLAVFECHITTLNPGQASHDPHRHPQEELILLKEGRLEVHINGRTQEAGPGSVFLFNTNDAHAVRNIGSTRATYWVVNLATASTHNPDAQNRQPTLASTVFDWEQLKVETTKTGARRQIIKGSTATLDSLTCHVTSLHGGVAAHGAHRHPDDEIVIVREGTMEANINGRAQTGGAGSIFFFASNDLHGMRNATETPASYYVIRMITAATPKVAAAKK